MRLNILLWVSTLLMLAISIVYEVNYIHYESPIPFNEINSITFKDFKGHAKPGLTLDGMNEFAFICTSRKLRHLQGNAIELTTVFHPSRSYVYNENIRNDGLLAHELYHFKISEYHSRLIRSEINEYNKKILNDDINEILDKYNLLEQTMQLQYDDECYHGYVLNKQVEWEKRIDSLLLSLKNFSNPVVGFTDNL